MRLKNLLLLLPLLWLPIEAPAIAQNVQVGMPIRISRLPACTYQRTGVGYYVYNGASTSDCSLGTGTTPVLCVCNNSHVWVASSSVPNGISYAGQVLIESTGAGNDITLDPADDLIFTPADDLTATVVGDAVLNAATVAVGGTTTIAFDAAGGTDELGIAEASVSVSAGIAFRLVGGAAPPVVCAAGVKGTVYFDTDINKLCICNGTNYVLANDDSTTTGCS